jgi:MFS family permease
MVKKRVSFRRAALARGQRQSVRVFWKRSQRRVLRFTAGGRWTDKLLPAVKHNMRALWLDGLFANTSEEIMLVYLSLYVLALGATRAQIGLMSALASLGSALLLLPGAVLVERWGRRRQIVLLTGGGAARVALLLMPWVPLVFVGPAAVYVLIALAVARTASSQLGVPAWMSLTADIVPLSGRGRYFATRNIAMGLVGTVVILLVGQLITRVGGPAGYQLAMGIAFAFGLAATVCYAQIREPAAVAIRQASERGNRTSLFQHLRAQPGFLAFCTTAALWNFSVQVAAPFFSPYLVQSLGASAGVIGALRMVNSLAALPGQRLFGPLADRWGPRRVQLVTGLLIPLLPAAWALVRSPWHVVPIYLVGGFLWAGYKLASFNFLLTITPEDRRPHYSALYQIAVTVALAAGAAVGGVVAEWWGYIAIFILSAIGRLSAALLFARFVRRAAKPAATEADGDEAKQGDAGPPVDESTG